MEGNSTEKLNKTVSSAANGMATASLIMGILAVVTSLFLMGIIFGGLGICFALLSRGAGKMHSVAVGGLICSVIGLVIGLVIFIIFGVYVMYLGFLMSGGGML